MRICAHLFFLYLLMFDVIVEACFSFTYFFSRVFYSNRSPPHGSELSNIEMANETVLQFQHDQDGTMWGIWFNVNNKPTAGDHFQPRWIHGSIAVLLLLHHMFKDALRDKVLFPYLSHRVQTKNGYGINTLSKKESCALASNARDAVVSLIVQMFPRLSGITVRVLRKIGGQIMQILATEKGGRTSHAVNATLSLCSRQSGTTLRTFNKFYSGQLGDAWFQRRSLFFSGQQKLPSPGEIEAALELTRWLWVRMGLYDSGSPKPLQSGASTLDKAVEEAMASWMHFDRTVFGKLTPGYPQKMTPEQVQEHWVVKEVFQRWTGKQGCTPTPLQARAIAHILNGEAVVSVNLGVGLGKTIVALIKPLWFHAAGLRLCPFTTLFIVPKRLIADQVHRFLLALQLPVVQMKGRMAAEIHTLLHSSDRPSVIIGTIDQFVREDLQSVFLANADRIGQIIMDEAHQVLCPWTKSLRRACIVRAIAGTHVQLVLLSGTLPPRFVPNALEALGFSRYAPASIVCAPRPTKEFMYLDMIPPPNSAAGRCPYQAATAAGLGRLMWIYNRGRMVHSIGAIFVRVFTKKGVENTVNWINACTDGAFAELKAAPYHADMQDDELESNMEKWTRGEVNMLVATEKAAEGLDARCALGIIVMLDLSHSQVDQSCGRIGRPCLPSYVILVKGVSPTVQDTHVPADSLDSITTHAGAKLLQGRCSSECVHRALPVLGHPDGFSDCGSMCSFCDTDGSSCITALRNALTGNQNQKDLHSPWEPDTSQACENMTASAHGPHQGVQAAMDHTRADGWAAEVQMLLSLLKQARNDLLAGPACLNCSCGGKPMKDGNCHRQFWESNQGVFRCFFCRACGHGANNCPYKKNWQCRTGQNLCYACKLPNCPDFDNNKTCGFGRDTSANVIALLIHHPIGAWAFTHETLPPSFPTPTFSPDGGGHNDIPGNKPVRAEAFKKYYVQPVPGSAVMTIGQLLVCRWLKYGPFFEKRLPQGLKEIEQLGNYMYEVWQKDVGGQRPTFPSFLTRVYDGKMGGTQGQRKFIVARTVVRLARLITIHSNTRQWKYRIVWHHAQNNQDLEQAVKDSARASSGAAIVMKCHRDGTSRSGQRFPIWTRRMGEGMQPGEYVCLENIAFAVALLAHLDPILDVKCVQAFQYRPGMVEVGGEAETSFVNAIRRANLTVPEQVQVEVAQGAMTMGQIMGQLGSMTLTTRHAPAWDIEGSSITWTADDNVIYTASIGALLCPVGMQNSTCTLIAFPQENRFVVQVKVQGRAEDMFSTTQKEVPASAYKPAK